MEKGFPEWLALDPNKIKSTASASTGGAEDEAKREQEEEQAQEDYE